uniref:F-box domain-containing protein n=1 Tax=Leersia perrieri TaxID=77586 RepID=A0A0D9XT25_9ORYZ
MDRLPDDVFVDEILSRLRNPIDLATCHHVCTQWRDAVDSRRLLATLPLPFHGVYIDINEHGEFHLLVRHKNNTTPIKSLDFLPNKSKSWLDLVDHCNGLLLYHDEFHNNHFGIIPQMYLVIDPAAANVSPPCHEVFVPSFPWTEEGKSTEELPPELYGVEVFSSRMGRWEERRFAREGGAVVTRGDVYADKVRPFHYLMGPDQRLSLSDNKYKVIKTPTAIHENEVSDTDENGREWERQPYLGRSEKGIYFVEIYKLQCWVWTLDESHEPMEWVLTNHVDISPLYHWIGTYFYNGGKIEIEAPWILDDSFGSNKRYNIENDTDTDTDNEEDDDREENQEDSSDNEMEDDTDGNQEDSSNDEENKVNQEKFEWNSDDDYNLEIEEGTEDFFGSNIIHFLGFHPYKEVMFFGRRFKAVAYHLGLSKAKFLGYFYPSKLSMSHGTAVLGAFPYTPCFVDALTEGPSEINK